MSPCGTNTLSYTGVREVSCEKYTAVLGVVV